MRYAILFLMLTACTANKVDREFEDISKEVRELLVSSSKQNGCLAGVKELRDFGITTYKEDLAQETRFHMVAFCLRLK